MAMLALLLMWTMMMHRSFIMILLNMKTPRPKMTMKRWCKLHVRSSDDVG